MPPLESPVCLPDARRYLPACFEAALVLLSCALCFHLAQPLGAVPDEFWRFDAWAVGLPGDLVERTAWLNAHAGSALSIVALAGWVALLISRQASSLSVRLPLIVAVWSLAGYLVAGWVGRGPMERTALPYAYLALTATAIMLTLSVAIAQRNCQDKGRFAHHVASFWVYPGWLLFGGLGNLWLLDFAARGYAKYAYIGTYQFDAWLLANGVLTLCAASLPNVLTWAGRRLAGLEAGRSRGIPAIVAAVLAWVIGIALFSRIFDPRHQHVAVLTEALRLPVWFAVAWLTYRWVGNGLRPASGLGAASLLLAGMVLSLFIMDDKGPILAQAIALSLILSSMMAGPIWQRYSSATGLAAAGVLATILLSTVLWAVFAYAPAERRAAVDHPHQGQLEFLSEIGWFLHAAPSDGYGLGQVPWCGNAALLAGASCAGVPRQIQSDYVFAALAGVWGALQATLLIALLLAWLAALVITRFRRASGRAVDLDNLAGWLIAGGATAYATQTVISSLGTLGVIPLTGVSIPLFAYGGTSLLTLGILTGMAVNAIAHPRRIQGVTP